jgi:hypothetical protein
MLAAEKKFQRQKKWWLLGWRQVEEGAGEVWGEGLAWLQHPAGPLLVAQPQ